MKKNDKTGKSLHFEVLEKIQQGVVVESISEKALQDYFSDVAQTAEAVEESDNKMADVEPNKNDEAEEKSAPVENFETLESYLERVKNRPVVEKRSPMNIDRDIIDFLMPIKKKTGIPFSHLVECILTDWIERYDEELQLILHDNKKNKYIKRE